MIPEAKPATSPQDRHFWVFQVLYMLGYLFHAAEEWDHPFETVLTILLIFLFLQFDKLREWVFLTFIVLLSLRNINMWPGLANHSNVLLFVCLFLIPLQVRRCLERPNPRTQETVATLRWIILLMYFFAGFHKLNRDFFNPEVSCSFDKMQDYLTVLGVKVSDLPAAIQNFVPLSVILMELLPPLLFLWGKTQKYGIFMLLLIHGLLAPVGFADFSSLAMSMLWLFVPPEAMDKMPSRKYFVTLVTVLVFMQLFMAYDRILTGDAEWGYFEGVAVILGFTPVWFFYFRSGVPGPNMHFPKAWSHRAMIAFMIFFGMNNYLGLRTAGTLSMFSNLVTEGERSNHYLLGSNPIKIFGFQEDVVELISVDPRVHGKYRRSLRPGNRIPRIEFDRILDRLRYREYGNLTMTVHYEGQRYTTTDLVNDPDFDFSVPWWQKKYFKFRLIQPEPPQACHW